MKKIILFVIIVCLSFCVACSRKEPVSNNEIQNVNVSNNINVVDYENRTVTLTAIPKRIIVMSDTILGPMVQMGASENIIGIDVKVQKNSDNLYGCIVHPELKNLPIVGSVKEPNFEKIIELDPDLIIIKSSGDAADNIQTKTGIPVISMKTLNGLDYHLYELLGQVLGKEEKSKELITIMQSDVVELTEKLSSIPEEERKKAFCSIFTSNKEFGNTFKDMISMRLGGGINVAETVNDVNSWGLATVSKEQILEWDPDYLFVEKPMTDSSATLEDVKADPILQLLDCVNSSDLYYTYEYYSIPKDFTRIIAEAYYFANIFYPNLIDDDYAKGKIENLFMSTYGISRISIDNK